MSTPKSPLQHKAGFTLIEVLLAVMIMAGSLIVINGAWSGNGQRFRKASLYNNVTFLLERKMNEIEIKYKDKPLQEIPEAENGDFGKDFPEYSWKMKTQNFVMPDLAPVIMGQNERADELLITTIRQTSEYISKAVKEVKVSVLVKTPARTVEYYITTLIVDYNSEASIGPGGAAGGASDGN